MTHIILFLVISASTSFVCTLMKTRKPDELLLGTVRFFIVLVIGIFMLGLVIQITQSFGGMAGIICVVIVASGAIAYHYTRPHSEEEKNKV